MIASIRCFGSLILFCFLGRGSGSRKLGNWMSNSPTAFILPSKLYARFGNFSSCLRGGRNRDGSLAVVRHCIARFRYFRRIARSVMSIRWLGAYTRKCGLRKGDNVQVATWNGSVSHLPPCLAMSCLALTPILYCGEMTSNT